MKDYSSLVRAACQIAAIGAMVLGSWLDLQERMITLQTQVEVVVEKQSEISRRLDSFEQRQRDGEMEIALLREKLGAKETN
ncbi:MAG: hypothetical protein AB7F23_08870 [Phycisphaerae bacterium]|jgi:hypothetical protein